MEARYESALKELELAAKPRAKERHQLGEVFTSVALVDEMLDRLPAAVWTDPALRWLDPAAAFGQFPLRVFWRLYEGLKGRMPDDEARAAHIVSKMLFLVDINEASNAISRRLLESLAPGSRANVGAVDKKLGFLASGPVHGLKHFDCIVGNPPYQFGSVKVARFTKKSKSAQAGVAAEDRESGVWVRFVERSINLLKSGGYLVFVHPITWFKKDRLGAHGMILSHQLTYLKVLRNFEARKYFGGGFGIIHVAFYVLQKAAPTKPTLIEYAGSDFKERLQLGPESLLILQYNGIYAKVRAKVGLLGDAEDLDLKHRTLKSCSARGTHKLIRLISEDGSVKYVRSADAHKNQTKPKLIVSGIHRPVLYFDKSGTYGLYAQGQRHYFLGSQESLAAVAATFKTKLMSLLLDQVKYEQDFIRPGLLPDLRGLDLGEAALAKYFGFTAAERAAIRAARPTIDAGRAKVTDCPDT